MICKGAKTQRLDMATFKGIYQEIVFLTKKQTVSEPLVVG